jgi:hypothetical protein
VRPRQALQSAQLEVHQNNSLRGDFGLLEMFVTADSKPLGRGLAEIEESYGVKVALMRDDEIITSPDAVAQEGDYLIAMGAIGALRDLSS